jgi:hypothetical protein
MAGTNRHDYDSLLRAQRGNRASRYHIVFSDRSGSETCIVRRFDQFLLDRERNFHVHFVPEVVGRDFFGRPRLLSRYK